MQKVYIEWYGCALSRAEAERMRAAFQKAGYALVEKPEESDICIVHTCAVKAPTEEKIISRLKKLVMLSRKYKFEVYASGCLAIIAAERLKREVNEVKLLGLDEKLISKIFEIPLSFAPQADFIPYNECIAILPVATGCLSKCSYCCVHIARGRLKSYSIAEVLEGFKRALACGYKEIWLTATDIACYGFDIGTNLAELIKELLKERGDFRIRIGMLNPQFLKLFIDEFLEAVKDERVYKFFHLPAQAGSDKVLRDMLRGYKANEVIELAEKIRKSFPDALIASDIIVGFPTESEQDFEETMEFLKKLRPDIVNVSRFWKRKGSAAEHLKEIEARVVKERSKKLEKLLEDIALEINKQYIGKKLKVLVSERGMKGNFVGRAQNYKAVVIKENLLCRFALVEIEKAKPTHLEGRVVKLLS